MESKLIFLEGMVFKEVENGEFTVSFKPDYLIEQLQKIKETSPEVITATIRKRSSPTRFGHTHYMPEIRLRECEPGLRTA